MLTDSQHMRCWVHCQPQRKQHRPSSSKGRSQRVEPHTRDDSQYHTFLGENSQERKIVRFKYLTRVEPLYNIFICVNLGYSVLPRPFQHSDPHAFHSPIPLMWEPKWLMWSQTPPKPRPPARLSFYPGENPGGTSFNQSTMHGPSYIEKCTELPLKWGHPL